VIFRRKELPLELVPARKAFDRVLAELEPGKAALADALPGTRLPGRPLVEALVAFEERAASAATAMPGWRCEPLEPEWRACDAGLARARARARGLREDGPDVAGFEALLSLVRDLMDELEPFASAARRFDALRVPRRA
jgi:hypothetical protein